MSKHSEWNTRNTRIRCALILSNEGVTLADIYTAGAEVLMGTMRWEKESTERVANEVAEVAGQFKRVTLDAEEAVLEVRAKAVQTELLAIQVEKTLLERTTASRKGELSRGHKRIRELRGGYAAKPVPKGERHEPPGKIQISSLRSGGSA